MLHIFSLSTRVRFAPHFLSLYQGVFCSTFSLSLSTRVCFAPHFLSLYQGVFCSTFSLSLPGCVLLHIFSLSTRVCFAPHFLSLYQGVFCSTFSLSLPGCALLHIFSLSLYQGVFCSTFSLSLSTRVCFAPHFLLLSLPGCVLLHIFSLSTRVCFINGWTSTRMCVLYIWKGGGGGEGGIVPWTVMHVVPATWHRFHVFFFFKFYLDDCLIGVAFTRNRFFGLILTTVMIIFRTTPYSGQIYNTKLRLKRLNYSKRAKFYTIYASQ